jgi:hypothetical protein
MMQEEISLSKEKKRIQGGKTTTDLILSAYIDGNSSIFPKILKLHVPIGATVADVTYGKGIFWKNVPKDDYNLLPTDITMGIDCRNLPYKNESIDCVILDPPYAEGFYRRSQISKGALTGSHDAFWTRYGNQQRPVIAEGSKYFDVVLDLYFKAGQEAKRVLRKGGVLIVKCQDQVSANKQCLLHVDLINYYRSLGFYAKDLFVAMRSNKPCVSRILTQVHARKNHSYFLVFIKTSQSHPEVEKDRSGKDVPAAKLFPSK